MGVVVDTSIFIGHERDRLAIEFPAEAAAEDLFISVITASELLVGVHRADSEARRSRRAAFVEGVLSRFPTLPIDTAVARLHARLLAAQLASGSRSGAHDLLIAATAMAHGFSVLTTDVADFAKVAGLDLLPVQKG